MEYCPLRRGDKGPDQSPCTSTWLEVAIDVGGKKMFGVWRMLLLLDHKSALTIYVVLNANTTTTTTILCDPDPTILSIFPSLLKPRQ